LTGVTPSSINNSTSQTVPFGNTQKTYVLNSPVTYPSNGKEVDSYYWTIPNGWKYNGVASNGQVFITSGRSITVVPNPITSGKVTVKGHTNCGFESNPQELAITRPTISIQSPKSLIYQGDVAPIIMYLSIPHSSGYSYTWKIPNEWQFQGGIKTTPSVTVIPDGCTGGQVTCTITCDGQSVSASPLTITSKPFLNGLVPTISGNSYLCANEHFSIADLPNNTSSINWSINSLALVSSGQGTQNVVMNPIGSSSGTTTIGVNISISGCTPFPIGSKEVWVGAPKIENIVGPQHVDIPFTIVAYTINPYSPLACASYSWNVTPSYDRLEPAYVGCIISFPYEGDFWVTVNAQNTCGISNEAQLFVGVGIYEPYIIYPNPSTESATISINETDNQRTIANTANGKRLDITPNASYTISVCNSMGFEVFHKQTKGKKINIVTSHLKEGTYIVSVRDGKNSFKKQLVVKH